MKSIIISFAIFLALFTSSVFAATKVSPPSNLKKQSVHIINLNKADVAELKNAYKGISMRRAKAIVTYRGKHGPFRNVAELAKVKQIGKAYIKRNLSGLEKVFTVSD